MVRSPRYLGAVQQVGRSKHPSDTHRGLRWTCIAAINSGWTGVMPRLVSKSFSSRATHYVCCRPSPSQSIDEMSELVVKRCHAIQSLHPRRVADSKPLPQVIFPFIMMFLLFCVPGLGFSILKRALVARGFPPPFTRKRTRTALAATRFQSLRRGREGHDFGMQG